MAKVELTDINGVELTDADTSGLNSGLYSITFAGAGTDYAYLGVGGNLSLELKSINMFTKSATTLAGEIQYYTEGTITDAANWAKKTICDFTFTTAEAQTYNNILIDNTGDSVNETIDGTPMRIKITVGGACTVYLKVVKR